MAKLKRKSCLNATNDKRATFPRRAKDQSIANLETLAVIMEVFESGSCSEDEKIKTDCNKKKRNKPTKKSAKQSHPLKTNNKIGSDNSISLKRMSNRRNRISETNKIIEQTPPVSLPKASGLSHFMELGVRTDLLGDSHETDPLGPDNFQWVEVKEEVPDDVEVCQITFPELLVGDESRSGGRDEDHNSKEIDIDEEDVKAIDEDYVKEIDEDDVKEIDEDDTKEICDIVSVEWSSCDVIAKQELTMPVAYDKSEDKAVEAKTNVHEEEDNTIEISLEVDDTSGGNISSDEDPAEHNETENVEELSSQKKRKTYPQKCDICDKKLCSKTNLRNHKWSQHKLKEQFACELCGLKFDLQRAAVRHRNSVHRGEDGRFECGVCDKRILDFYSYLTHVRSHADRCVEEEGSDKLCAECDKSFRDDQSLKIHRTLVHSVDLSGRMKGQLKDHVCDTCGRRFAFSCLLRDHINTHTGVKPYLCQQCGKAFCQKSTLKQHARTHSEVRPFQCAECPQGFYAKGDFVKHQRKHTGERPYVCEVCGEGFSRNTHLVIHRRTHTGERPHVCDICDRRFTKRGDVLRHRRVHTGELPYLCQVCGKAFRQSTQCANHIKSQHPDSVVSVARNPNPLEQRVHLEPPTNIPPDRKTSKEVIFISPLMDQPSLAELPQGSKLAQRLIHRPGSYNLT